MDLVHLMTIKEVADFLRLSTQTIYKMVEKGEIPAMKIGNQWRFDQKEIYAWVKKQGSQASEDSKDNE